MNIEAVKIAKYTPHSGLKTKGVHRVHIEIKPSHEGVVRDALGGDNFDVKISQRGVVLIGSADGRWRLAHRKASKVTSEALVLALTHKQVRGLTKIPEQALDTTKMEPGHGNLFIPWIPEARRRAPKRLRRGQGSKARAPSKTALKNENQTELPLERPTNHAAKASPFTERDIRNLSAALNEAIMAAKTGGVHIKISQRVSGEPIDVTSVTHYV